MKFPDYKREIESIAQGYSFAAGCDEVGVAPLAGPVVAAACILRADSIGKYRSKNKWYSRVRDSKTTSGKERETLLEEILKNIIAYGVGEVWQDEIDSLNIHHASLKAMRLAVEDMMSKLPNAGEKIFLFIDGRFKIPDIKVDQKNIIDGDALVLSISAASIIAKVHRDKIMKDLHEKFPVYGFDRHKGYATSAHRAAIKKYGPIAAHRKSFLKPVNI
jgi:ribonuclease HII